jgi:hypothetical protein
MRAATDNGALLNSAAAGQAERSFDFVWLQHVRLGSDEDHRPGHFPIHQ